MGASGSNLAFGQDLPPDGVGEGPAASEQELIPVAGTLQGLVIKISAAPGPNDGDVWIFLVEVNGTLVMQCSIAGSSTTCGSGASASVSPGDVVSIHIASAGAPAAATASYGMVLTT
jgi:hypothetical protein